MPKSQPHPQNIVVSGQARFSVLAPGLLRLEYALDGRFEDRATFFAVQRNAAPQAYQVWQQPGGGIQLETTRLRLSYRPDGQPFHRGNLEITVLGAHGGFFAQWTPGMVNTGNLGGTLRTLDEVQGPVPLDDGILSRSGWTLKDDSATVLLTDEATPWVGERPANGQDWYFFGYGLDYAEALAALTTVSGKVPLPPRYALGSWYSRYWPYSADEFLEIADGYAAKQFPLDVMVIDMDWHQEGWTGYTWNQGLIPDPEGLLRRLHAKGLRTTLNLHPHQGVGPHEAAFDAFAQGMGQDPAKKETVPFDVTSRRFMANYFDKLIHPLEEQGVDFWWMDWQQGTSTGVKGLDPLMWLNHQHYRDSQRPRGSAASPRGMAFSRFAGLGDHRHPVHFSGDTHGNWEVLQFLSYFTATAGNVGVAYWSHDLGGHFSAGGRTDAELYLRWLQFGAVSPIMRLHSSRDPLCDRRPWVYGDAFADAARKAFELHAQLLPYLYTLGRQCYDSGLPLLRPMYLHYAEQEKAYQVPDQFMLGADLLVAPVARPGFGPLKVVHVPVWFPEGDWYHLETHERFSGPLETVVPVPWDSMAIFARGGAPIPLQAKGGSQMSAEAAAIVRLYPGPAASRDLYQDDGLSSAYEGHDYRKTLYAARPTEQGQDFVAGPSLGSYPGASAEMPALTLEIPAPAGLAGAGGAALGTDADGLCRVTLPARPLDSHSTVQLSLPAPGPLTPLRDCLRAMAREAELAAGQLEGHSILKGRAQELQKALQSALAGSRDWKSTVLAKQEMDGLHRRQQGLLRDLVEAGPDGEAALRVMAGVSLQAQVQTLPGGKHRLEVELRRSAHAVGSMVGKCQLRWRIAGAEAQASLELDPGRDCVMVWDLPLEIARQSLALTQGQVEIEILVMDQRAVLRESFAWDGRTVKDWLIMGPLKAGTQLEPVAGLAALDLDAKLEGADGKPQAWAEHSFDPSRVARGLRHFYDLGTAFQSKDAVCLAVGVIEAATAGPVELEFHHIGQARLWVNGREAYQPGSSRFRAELVSGPNLVQVRLQDAAHEGLGIHLAVHETAESGATGLRFRLPKKIADKIPGRR